MNFWQATALSVGIGLITGLAAYMIGDKPLMLAPTPNDRGITSVYTECSNFELTQFRDGRTLIEFNREEL